MNFEQKVEKINEKTGKSYVIKNSKPNRKKFYRLEDETGYSFHRVSLDMGEKEFKAFLAGLEEGITN